MPQHDETGRSPHGRRAADQEAHPFASAVTVLTILGVLAALAVPVVASRFRAAPAPPVQAAPRP